MGNNSTKESRSPPASSITGSLRSSISPTSSTSPSPSHTLPDGRVVYASRSARTGRPELTLFGHASTLDRDGLGIEPRRETKQEREARKAERERIARALEREKSLKHESVDGGYLVTLGVYTGPEDFSKTAVRQLQVSQCADWTLPTLYSFWFHRSNADLPLFGEVSMITLILGLNINLLLLLVASLFLLPMKFLQETLLPLHLQLQNKPRLLPQTQFHSVYISIKL